jgi:CubicO group peptidase (beta-lactamase class C family)
MGIARRIAVGSMVASILVGAGSCLAVFDLAAADKAGSADELAGLWKAQHHYGPKERGPIVIQRTGNRWSAEFMGSSHAVLEKDRVLTFELPGGKGVLRALVQPDGSLRGGQWFQPNSDANPPFGTNIAFTPHGPNRWRGEVRPIEDTSTYFLLLQKRPDGSVGALIRNREFNRGVRYNAERIVRDGPAVQVIGRPRGRDKDTVVAKGTVIAVRGREPEVIRLEFDPPVDGAYDFTRADERSDFYPRGKNPGRYVYRAPPALADGWPTATLDDVNIDRRGIESFVQVILDRPMDAADAMQIDAILLARHGKLVLEEYFHGFDRNRTHSTRSAGKSLTAVLVGAAMQAGLPVKLHSPVYEVMNGGAFPQDLEPRKRAMTLENLLTMTSGLFCDDGNPDSPGNEEAMTNQDAEPDFYRFYMGVPTDRQPGAESVYCSGDSNLAIGVLHRATGEHPMDLFDRLLGRPMQIPHQGWYVSPSRQPYGGGSINMIPRDYMKLGQLMLNKGTWNGHRILSEEFVQRASSPLYDLNNIRYGYQWWVIDWPYKDRTVRAFFAGGNGGQGVIVIPELDMVISTWGSSYGTRVGLEIQQGLTPRYILPAVREKGDALDKPVVPREYEVIYGRRRATR